MADRLRITALPKWIGPAAMLALLLGFPLQAAEGEPDAEPAPAAEDAQAVEPALAAKEMPPATAAPQRQPSIGELVFRGEWYSDLFYYVLAGFSIVATTVTLERLVSLRRGRIVPREFRQRLEQTLARRGDSIEDLLRLCEPSPAPVARVLKAGLLRAGRPLAEVEKAMEDAAQWEADAMRGRNRVLSVIANVAPLVGLLGTVVGMILAFRVSSQAGLGKGELLAEGIYLALLTTMIGLSIAIPCLLLVAWFNSRVDRRLREIDHCLQFALPLLLRVEGARPPLLHEAALARTTAAAGEDKPVGRIDVPGGRKYAPPAPRVGFRRP